MRSIDILLSFNNMAGILQRCLFFPFLRKIQPGQAIHRCQVVVLDRHFVIHFRFFRLLENIYDTGAYFPFSMAVR
ncbi:hypothetical protein CSA56_09910 [candidate division KSB3 bacterium]|uniref:Uncharacterized protein n=1 Tax=candidate division KSB3 bacterium TaxID=2044937 RepID=A0A2G6KDR0_9BACT|nr:MAG: hypothetical protein CSA56_09910 [candidate division KSB3 bacterium]